MARLRKTTALSGSSKRGTTTKWSSLTWEDVDRWAGSRCVSRGRAYQRQGRVTDLVLREDGRLLATVMGGNRYVTSVWLAPGRGQPRKLESTCTCPVGFDGCKHAVAVVMAFLELLGDRKEVPVATSDDPRWAKLSKHDAELDQLGEEPEDEFTEELDDECDYAPPEVLGGPAVVDGLRRTTSVTKSPRASGGLGSNRRSRNEWDEKIRLYIREKSREELAELVCTFVERFRELRGEFQERIALADGDVDRLVNQTRRDLNTVTAEVGWRNDWNGEGHTPSYAGVKHKIERLVDAGHYDHVVTLGAELLRRGMRQIEQSHDEGETATEISDCLPFVFDALARSSRPVPDKILYAIDAHLQDEFDVIGETADAILGAQWQRADWSVVADRLVGRLKDTTRSKNVDDFTRNYRRDRVSNWLLTALEHAGRSDELPGVYVAEARTTGSYQRLVGYLLSQGQLEDAERWAREGIEKTRVKWPGIASDLIKTLCELARRRKEWNVVAAHAARDFFERPGVVAFRELVAAAEKAKCGERVRAAALEFLESGQWPTRLPEDRAGRREGAVDSAWPLPTLDYLAPCPEPGTGARSGVAVRSAVRPYYDVLLQMAIADKRPNDALHWYDKMVASGKQSSGLGGWGVHSYSSFSDEVAEAVASTHPERALDIYRRGLDAHLEQANISAYERCAVYLGKMRPILTSLGRDKEWTHLLADVRQNYRNRPRFMEILDKLEGRTILRTHKSRSGR